MKKFNVITGLPRSGSTLLANILNQNPKFHASETSALPRILINVKSGWENIPENVASNNLKQKVSVLKNIPHAYYAHIDKEVIFDKNRVWSSEPELLKFALGEDTKIFVCVRTLTDVLASFEKLFRSNNSIWDIADKKNFDLSTIEKRCDLWASDKGPVGSSLLALNELLIRSPKNVVLIDFDSLVQETESVLDDIYKELGEERYPHDLENIEQTTVEDDRFHGILGLHKIKNKIEIPTSNSRLILGDSLFKKYSGGELWRK